MNIKFIYKLSKETKIWIAQAVAGLITADRAVCDEEVQFLRKAIDFLDDKAEILKVIDLVKLRNKPSLGRLEIDLELSCRILFFLSEVIVADHTLTKGEIEYFQTIGMLLGMDSEKCFKIVQWSNKSYHLQLKKENLIEDLLYTIRSTEP